MRQLSGLLISDHMSEATTPVLDDYIGRLLPEICRSPGVIKRVGCASALLLSPLGTLEAWIRNGAPLLGTAPMPEVAPAGP